jgi:hypothetical protein
MAKAARVMATLTKRVMGTATTWAMVMAMRVAGNKEGNGKGGKSDGNEDKECHRKEKGEGNSNNTGNGDGCKGGGQLSGQWEKTAIN